MESSLPANSWPASTPAEIREECRPQRRFPYRPYGHVIVIRRNELPSLGNPPFSKCRNVFAHATGRRSNRSRNGVIYGSTRTLIIRWTSSSFCGVQEVRMASIRFRMSCGSSSRSRTSRRFGGSPNPLAIATIVSRLGTFFPRSTSPKKLPVMLPRSAASSRLSLAAGPARTHG